VCDVPEGDYLVVIDGRFNETGNYGITIDANVPTFCKFLLSLANFVWLLDLNGRTVKVLKLRASVRE
jgi:hypothetical protein